ncbi:PKD domain-containing protein [Rhodocaloribacter litoris]|uniref:OmpA family protein n=1 Tax=Rhodocaloribacter litoris TaxID=2558931 RepID=UPI00141E2E1C|nr:PKD domain-containing protein [Rhodocaloribacter litoris]QXD13995.1 PKD domain-containing protein [Rhodocaloribacter litoris]
MKSQTTFPLVAAVLFALSALGMIGCRSVPVEVLSVNGPDSLQTNQAGTFTATINEAEAKKPITTTWNFGDNTTAEGTTATHSYSQPGNYTVTFTATNRGGRSSDSETLRVVVVNPPVPAQITSLSADNMNPDTRTAVRFQASVRGDQPLSYNWSFGDGGTSTDASPTHTFSNPGTYTVTLNVRNRHGSDSRTLTLNVRLYEAAICREITEMNAAFFDRNSSVLTEAARAALQDNLDILSECPNLNVRVEGFAAPGERNAQQLSTDRARAVEQFYTQGGIPASRIVAQGRGRVTGITSKKEGTSQYRRADTIPVR